MKKRVKICCISTIEEAKIAVDFGASAVGLVGKMPSGPGVIQDELIFQIAKSVPPPIATFLLTSETSANKIIAHHQRTQTNTIQIVDKIPIDAYSLIREKIPFIKLVQVIHVLDEKSIEEAMEVSQFVDALLLDSGNPNKKIKELGGTGRIHNWELSKKIVEYNKVPVFLAGGINSENVKQAIDEVNPFGIDICSGVRTNGKLDKTKLEKLFTILNIL